MAHRFFDGMTINGYEVDTSQVAETGKVYVGDEEYDISDFFTDDDKKQVYEEDMMRTKEDILYDIDLLLREIDNKRKTDTKRSQNFYNRYVDLITRFRKKVEGCTFPEKLEDWWHYEYCVKETGITLNLIHADDVGFNDEGYIDFVFVDTEFSLITVSAEMMTVEQYAKLNEVTTTAVRQWIRRGKIRTAVKQGGEWRIPELAEVRDRGYRYAQYEWETFLTSFPEEYSYINDFGMVTIEQDKEHKDVFNIELSKSKRKKETTKKMQMEQKEKERFELLLITDPFVTPVDAIITNRG